MLSRKEDNMKIFQKVQGNLATNLYVTSNNKTAAFASKPVASVDVTLTRMNVKTGSERLLKSFKTSSADEALRLAEKQFGKMTEVKIARGLHSAGAYDKASIRSAARSFKTARRKLSAEERLHLIDEDRYDEDWDY